MQNFVSSGELPLEVLQKGLDSFRNTKDRDIEFFLREKALDFEKRHWCSTYLLIDEDTMIQSKSIKVEGYFTLSNKVLTLNEKISIL